jgi:hypothetical protein
MRRKNMKQKRTNITEIYKLGQTLGINTTDINALLYQKTLVKEQVTLAIGPPHYGSGYYGVISINEFKQ